ncbi:MAG: phosphoribosylformylglycinamidine cyclo-ligase [Gammaproteobacteria bacterium RIFCSPHIGHO2_12_FULL_45_9]|nr:MAG: phosphoribosylformylglycinamidine cyclo-ligase [Gammaproteobacteria bacterium RIFCSPHIGHO2_12_FULL_45_9]
MSTKPLTYENAGVHIDTADTFIERLKPLAKRTHRPGVLAGIGGFGALFELPKGYQEPVLVSGTDGVGTKLRLAIDYQQHDTIGIDLVAMCVNDIVTSGATPLFFLDYYATGRLDPDQATAILSGIAKGCEESDMALVGGETAEMPGCYTDTDYDLAGFCVGVVEKRHIVDGKSIRPGDCLLALSSSGPHANGYSLIRHILERGQHRLDQPFQQTTLGAALLTPTRLYPRLLQPLFAERWIQGAAHITGGGITDNLPRILPQGTRAVIDTQSWTIPPLFQWLIQEGQLSLETQRRTLNLGVGMILVVHAEDEATVIASLQAQGETPWKIGHIAQHADQPDVLFV